MGGCRNFCVDLRAKNLSICIEKVVQIYLLTRRLEHRSFEIYRLNMISEVSITWTRVDHFYRKTSQTTYLTQEGSSSTSRGTERQKHKRCVSIVMCINAGGSHGLSVSYIGTASNPKCFQDARFIAVRQNYRSQSNGWMDSKRFLQWISTWYEEVKNVSNGPWLLPMDC